ncbi:hypothetical protein BJX64DRAFT_265673, partial [Aspergillus heterothallicus]
MTTDNAPLMQGFCSPTYHICLLGLGLTRLMRTTVALQLVCWHLIYINTQGLADVGFGLRLVGRAYLPIHRITACFPMLLRYVGFRAGCFVVLRSILIVYGV